MMFKSLYSRLAITLAILLCIVGLILVELVTRSSVMYQQEVAQKLNISLAEHIAADQPLMLDQKVNHAVLDGLFHNLMVINPSIELYLLDKQGEILSYSAPAGKVKRSTIALEPIKEFLHGGERFPLKGDDPRNLVGYKVFSAAEIKGPDGFQGYLYIVLGGEQYDHIVHMLGQSYIVDSSLQVLLVSLVAALLIGLLLFSFQTRRLRLLSNVIQRYTNRDAKDETSIRYPQHDKTRDEIDELGQQFNTMADKINDQIHELKRMDSMRREMVANVSHDLRTPLTTMRGYLETLLLKDDELSAQDKKKYLETALSHSEHLGQLVEELFELARLDSCEAVVYTESFSMCELVQDVVQKFILRAKEKSIRLEANLSRNSPMIYGDIGMMERVLENLLENGLKHTPHGGSISMSVEVDSANVVVKISDTGCGIAADDMPRIFERFYQKDANRTDKNSAGLGLAIVKRILELHGSIIKVQSEVNQGTTFSFQIAIQPVI